MSFNDTMKAVRESRSDTATVYQNDQACAVMLASFGSGRESMVSVQPDKAPDFKAPDEVQSFPFIPGLTPDFTQHFDYRYTVGTMPFMGSNQTEMGGWITLREDSEKPVSVASMLACSMPGHRLFSACSRSPRREAH